MKSTLRHMVAVGIAIAFLLVIGLTAGEQTSPVAAQGPSGQFVGKPVTAARTAVVNFSQIAANAAKSPARTPTRRVIPPPRKSRQSGTAPTGSIAPGLPSNLAGRASSIYLSLSPAPSASFSGLSDDGTVIPPDTTGAVGPNYLMETLNNNIAIQNRAGTVLSQVTLFSFWQSVLPVNSSGPFDPSVIYDPFNDRWIHVVATDDASTQSSVCVTVSQSSNPMLNWNLFCFKADAGGTLFADFPRLGFNKDWIVVTVNMFNNSAFVRGQVFAFNKTNLYSNSNSGHFVFTVASDNVTNIPFTMVPAVTLDNTLDTVYLVRQPDCNPCNTITKSTLVGSPPSTPTLTIDTATITSNLSSWYPDGGDFLPQLGGARGIAVNDDSILDVLVRTVGGVTSIWCSQTILLPDASPTHAAAQWWQLDANPTGTTIVQQGRIEDPTATLTNGGYHFAYPSIVVNMNGDMLIGYSRFSSAAYASAAYSFRWATDPANTTRSDVTLKAGMDYYNQDYGYGSNRWGDFSNTVVDPVNDIDMWTIQEYAKSSVSGEGRWGTWWGKVNRFSIYFFPAIFKSQ